MNQLFGLQHRRGTDPVCTLIIFVTSKFFVEMLCRFIFYAYLCNQQRRQ